MFEASEQELPAYFASRPPIDRVVEWGQGPLRFELRSADERVISRVATVVESWPAHPRSRLSRQWRVEPLLSDAGIPRWDAYGFSPDGVPRVRTSGTPAEVIHDIEFDAVSQLFTARDQLGLHGALVSRSTSEGERGLALIGPCLSGKSTLSCALWHRGWSFLCDDVTLFDGDGLAYPAPRRASIRHTSRALIGEMLWTRAERSPSSDRTNDGVLFYPHEVDGRPRPGRLALRAIVFLARYNVNTPAAQLVRISPLDAAIALVPHSNFRHAPFPEAVSQCASVVETVPVYDLGRGPIDDMMARLNRLFDSRSE